MMSWCSAPAAILSLSLATTIFPGTTPSAVAASEVEIGDVTESPSSAPTDPSSDRQSASDASRATLDTSAVENTPLGRPSAIGEVSTVDDTESASPRGLMSDAIRTGGALVLVITLIFGLRFLLRRMGALQAGLVGQLGPGGKAPSGVVAVLGRYPVSRGQTLVLLQVGVRVLLLSQSSSGLRTLSELTDPEEVAQLLLKTRDEDGQSMSERFRTLLKGASQDPSLIGEPGEMDSGGPVSMRIAGGMADVGVPVEAADQDEDTTSSLDGVASLRKRLAAISETED